ncbi:MAG: aminoglycoside phosphotransferase family protein [Desulfuromonadaceae bacterium]|nr:aminoglycoside phosphotransferase family protein [Desulfuromonadaceae bacterium]
MIELFDEYECFSGDNLLLLMDLPSSSSVLIVGDEFSFWHHVFQNAKCVDHIPTLASSTEVYELILYYSASSNSRRMFNADLKQAHQMLASNGSILLFAENTCSFKQLKNLVRGRFCSFFDKLWYRLSGYQNALHRSGFKPIYCFLPFPGLQQPEELVLAGSKMLELPHYAHPLLHLVNRFGGYLAIAEGFVILGGSNSFESSHLLQMVNEAISRQLQLPVANCLLERVDIRLRGTFVLFLTENNSGKGFIVRLVADRRIDSIVCKNHKFLEYLQGGAGLPASIMDKLPRPICRIEHDDRTVYAETMVAGMPAWKVNSCEQREHIFQAAVDFLYQVHFASCQNDIMTSYKLNILFADDQARLASCKVISADFRERVVALIETLQHRLIGTEIDLVISHGDYGYGNILVNPQSGSIQGIIDWDTGKASDFPGVDMMNLLIQKERAEKNSAVLPAFATVVGRGIAEIIGNNFRNYLVLLNIPENLHSVIVYLSYIRYVTRAAQYPNVFELEQNDYQAILDLLLERLPL